MRLYDPNTDNPTYTTLVRTKKHTPPARRAYDPQTHISRFRKTLSDGKGGLTPKLERTALYNKILLPLKGPQRRLSKWQRTKLSG